MVTHKGPRAFSSPEVVPLGQANIWGGQGIFGKAMGGMVWGGVFPQKNASFKQVFPTFSGGFLKHLVHFGSFCLGVKNNDEMGPNGGEISPTELLTCSSMKIINQTKNQNENKSR